MPKQKVNHYYEQPAPAEHIHVCIICAFEPETCGHVTLIKDRSWLRGACIWCRDWQTKERSNERF